MLLVFSVGVLWLGYVYVGYPLLALLLTFVRRVNPLVREDFLPTVSVLIAARNEEKDIGWKVTETLQWHYPLDRLEVLVSSDASEDGTDEVVQGIRDPRLRFVRLEQRSGKNVALNELAKMARGELLFFTDANAHIEPDFLRHITRHFADSRVGCVTGETHPMREERDLAVSRGARTYWGYESLLKRLESEIGSVVACNGAIFCIRRCLFVPLSPELANDLELPLRIGHAGYWIKYEPNAYVVERESSSPWEEFARRRRICAQGMLALLKLTPALWGLRGWQFFSRKFLRWLTLVPLSLILLASVYLVGQPPFAALLALQLIFYGSALVGCMFAIRGSDPGLVASVPFYVVLVTTAGLIGVVEACLGRRFQTWEVAKMSRGQEKVGWQRVN